MDVISFLKNNIEPVEDSNFGLGYNAAVTLKDGTFLPCVIFRNPSITINLAIKRFKEEQSGKSIFNKSSGLGYREIVKTFVTSGNRVNHYNIIKVEKSRHAFPIHIRNQIKGETSMSWTAFVARFKDGRALGFGTTWDIEFFDLPTGYQAEDIVEIINHSYLLKSGEIVSHRSFDRITRKDEMAEINGNKPFFECFIDNL
ncbi:hypothetical protein [Chitinophaga sp. YIM B06452]|uniref:hypothetical protein n=1 Tax=Chitinophaga sp. YIM B06452 TaxID=3082158 RepID=UPI0031FE85C4